MINKLKYSYFIFKEKIKLTYFGLILRKIKKIIFSYSKSQDDLYNDQTELFLKKILNDGDSGIDIGANRGDILEKFSYFSPNGLHIAFEPIPIYFNYLSRNFQNAKIFNYALSDFNRESKFNYIINAPGYSGLQKREYDKKQIIMNEIYVSERRLDDIIEENFCPKVIKIDVEGAEYSVLKGGIKLIKKCKPYILLEAGSKSTGKYGVTPKEFYNFFTDINYHITTLSRYFINKNPFNYEEFQNNWLNGPDYFYLAYSINN